LGRRKEHIGNRQKTKNRSSLKNLKENQASLRLLIGCMKFFIFQMVCHRFQTGLIPRLPNYKLEVLIWTFLSCELGTTGTKTKYDLRMAVSVKLMRYNGETVGSWSSRHEKGGKIKSACNCSMHWDSMGFGAHRSWNSHH